MLQAQKLVRHPLGLVEQSVRGAVIVIQGGLKVEERFDPGLHQHQHRVKEPLVLRMTVTEHHKGPQRTHSGRMLAALTELDIL